MPADGRGWGTGFFVASKQIITCAHVVQGCETEGVPIFWRGKALSVARVEQILPPPIDLALLLLDASDEESLPPAVLLDETFTPFDRLYVYGYPDDFPEGGSVTVQCEGDVREAEATLIKAQAGQIRPGLSGSPALNFFETGKVCGIVSDTRGRSTDLGGLLIPISTVFSCFPELKAQNQAAHPQDSLWHRLLSKQAQQSLNRSPFAAASFHFSNYRPETWTGREDAISELTQALQNGSHLLLIHGLTGIGKTTLAERLAADFAIPETYHRVAFDQGDRSQIFSRGALAILQTLGDDTAQQLPNEQLLPHLLKTLEQRSCWLQLDSVEYLLSQNDHGESHFGDPSWLDFFYQLLTQPSNTRIVLTSQALPTDLVSRCLRYDNFWHEFLLAGLERDHWLDLFRNYGVTPQTDDDAQHLCTIADYFEGHPLILKMIAGDISKSPFNGDVAKYWQEYYSQQQSQLAPKLRQSQEQRARIWVNQTIQSLPDLPRQMLQHCAVFRRSVSELFYSAMLPGIATSDANGALMLLRDRNLVEENDLQAGQFWLRQHNLIREVAYRNLRGDQSVWEAAERRAAHLWLNDYQPTPGAPNLETVRGYLEAFDHYCSIKDWDTAKNILLTPLDFLNKEHIPRQLEFWGLYQEGIQLCQRILRNSDLNTDAACLKMLGNYRLHLGNYPQALDNYEQSLTIAQEIGDKLGEDRILGNLGLVYEDLGQYERAIDFHQRQLIIAREIGDELGESIALGHLGVVYKDLGRYEQAINYHQQHLKIARKIGDRRGEGNASGNLGIAYNCLGQHERAIDFHQQHLTIARVIGNRQGEGNAFVNLGVAYYRLGKYKQAINFHQQALDISREIGSRLGEGSALINMGETQLKLNDYPESLTNIQAALEIFQEIGYRANEADALKNLAELYQATDEIEVARQYVQQALALATALGIPLKAECEALLAELDHHPSEAELS